jgi:sirohydrochlorin ferrochelatase
MIPTLTFALPWMVTAALAALMGVCLARYWVAPPLEMHLYLALELAALFALLPSLARAWAGGQWGGHLGLALAGGVAGYLALTMVFLSQREVRALPPITRAPGDPGLGHTAIVYFTHGEPPAYSPLPWLETFHEFDADRAPFIPAPFRPLFFHNLRREYLTVGGSAHNRVHQAMLKRLRASMPEAERQGARFYLAFLDSAPRPDEMAIAAVNAGASRVILAAVFLTESSHTQAGQGMVAALHLEQYGVSVSATEPLWNAAALKQMFVARANRHLGNTDKSRVGVLLVGHGQPAAWDKLYPKQTEQENRFRDDLEQLFIQDGYRPENLAQAWMEFKAPACAQMAKALAHNGIEKLFIFPTSISADSIHSDIQIPEAVAQARLPRTLEVVNMGAWGDDPLVIAALREKIEACAPHLSELKN